MLPHSSALSFKLLQGDDETARCPGTRSTEETVRRVAIMTILYLIPAICILQPLIFDPDIWWHLETGKWIVDHGTLPITDPFSVFGEGKSWLAYSWLFDVGMYELVHVFGESAIIAYTLGGVWVVMLVMHRVVGRRCTQFLLCCGLMTAGTLAISRLFTPRPWLLTIVFFAITLEVVLLVREGKWTPWFWSLTAIYMLWANVHIQFIYGLGLLGLACVAPVIDQYVKPFMATQGALMGNSLQWRRLIALTSLCTLATLITPYHVYLYSIVIQLSGQTGMWEYSQEMQAPAFRTVADWAMLVLFTFALIRLGRRRSWSSFEIVMLLVAGASAFRGLRDAWLLVLVAMVVSTSQKSDESKNATHGFSPYGLTAIIVFVTVGVVWTISYRDLSHERIQENTAKIYPIKAASFVEHQAYVGPLYNHFDWGGYLIWRLPHLKVSMDGRANVYGDERIKQALATWSGRPHWSDDQDLNHAQVVIAQKEIALTAILKLDPRFRVAYQDETAVVFIRAPSGSDQPTALTSTDFSASSLKIDVASSE